MMPLLSSLSLVMVPPDWALVRPEADERGEGG